MKYLLLSMLLVFTVGCRPDQEETDFGEMVKTELNSDGSSLSCEDIESLDLCEDSPQCQPVFEPDGVSAQDFMFCIGYADEDEQEAVEESADEEVAESESEEGSSSSEDSGSSSSDDSSSSSSEDEEYSSSDDDDDEEYSSHDYDDYSCGKRGKKVLVCHVPPGNVEAAHNICISINGWENGHSRRERESEDDIGSYLGACKKSDVEYYDDEDDEDDDE